ncbi:MAG: STAS domain-containing protein [Simplicispira sp.]|nr:STAS domain-containing protein [Simplicispira sp.]
MSKEESSRGGLLSKMVRFVRNPTVNWHDLDAIESDRESQYSKQVLKEIIERKRRNDFVRRREFDQLRKLRQRGALVGQSLEDPGARPSFFESSLTSPLERAVTIKKIDEIEAQMSMQWWKSKPLGHAQGLAPFSGGLSELSEEGTLTTHFPATAPLPPYSCQGILGPAPPPFFNDSMALSGAGSVPALGTSLDAHVPPGPRRCGMLPGPAVEMEEFVHEPDLEEAAIRFANGDHVGAETGLLDVLAQHAQDEAPQQFEIWMTLFDLYRATGQQERFDVLALDFAARFSRSAPLWFSLPEQLGLASAVQSTRPSVPVRRDFSWKAPATLTLQSVTALETSLARAALLWTLVWVRLDTIEEPALAVLTKEFTRWADQEVQIVFSGAEVLHALLQAHTQSGDSTGNTAWWILRMAALRFMNRPDEFELVALDYCVTYEVSPPSWVAPRCTYCDAPGEGAPAPTPVQDLLAKPNWSAITEPAPLALLADVPVAAPALTGHIEGDATAALQAMGAGARPGHPLVIGCERLIRIDFSAAGSVLNWAAEQQGKGFEVHFQDLHRLVAVFFNVIGISEHAWVIPRKN